MEAQDLPWDRLGLRRVPSQERSRDKVARALAAADAMVREDGPDSINLPRVAERAGVSVGALYQYLPDREAIVGALVWRYHSRLEAMLDAVVESARSEPPRDDPIGYIMDAVVQIYREEESARSLRATAQLPALEEQRRAHKARMAGKIADLLEIVGTEPGRHPETKAWVAFLAADAVLHHAFGEPEADRKETIRELGRLLTAYLT